MLPDWMCEGDYKQEISSGGRDHKPNFLAKSIREMRKVISNDLQTEHFANQDGLLQKLDPRFKLMGMIVLLLLTSFHCHIWALLALWGLTLLLMYFSGLPVMTLQKRIWGFIPLISFVLALPGTLNIFIDGSPLLILHQTVQPVNWLGYTWPACIFISKQGMLAAVILFLRVGISLSLGVLLTMTTSTAKLFKSMYILRVPHLFVMIMEMSYRYLVLLLMISIEMFGARNLRTVGKLPWNRQRLQAGSTIAALFARSMALSEEVYQAMAARCYTGELVKEADAAPWTPLESLLSAASS